MTTAEEAIAAAGWGKFNTLLSLLAIPSISAIYFATAAISFVIPSAECDLELTLFDKGLLNAVTYLGMIIAAVPWLLVADVKGRRPVLIYAHLLDALTVLCSALSPTKYVLLLFKFLGGCWYDKCITGGHSALIMYIAEMHRKRHRWMAMLLVGVMMTFASIFMPLLATLLLPQRWEYAFGAITFHSWQLFLAITALPSLVCGLGFLYMPESPTFLMIMGENELALEVLRKIFAMNTRRPREEYPISDLRSTIDIEKATYWHLVRQVGHEIKFVFGRKYVRLAICVFAISSCICMSQSPVLQWTPQLFASFKEYELTHQATGSLCTIFAHNVNKTETKPCNAIITKLSFLCNIMLGVTYFASFMLAFLLIRRMGASNVLRLGLLGSMAFGFLLYYAKSNHFFVVIVALYLAMASVNSTAIINTAIQLFPTQMGNTVFGLTLLSGRVGSVIGNLLFPYLIYRGCMAPVMWIGCVGLVACLFYVGMPRALRVSFS